MPGINYVVNLFNNISLGSRNGDESEHTLKSKKKTKNAAAAEFAKKEKTLMEEIADRAAQTGCLLEECPSKF